VDALIYDWDLRTNTIIRSQGLMGILGFRPDEVPAHPDWWMARIHPDDLPRVRSAVEAALAAGEQYDAEYRIRTRDDRYLHVWHKGQIVRDAEGRAIRVVGSVLDISRRREAEEAIRASEVRLRSIVETAVDGIIVIDERGAIEAFNPAAERLFGYTAEEVMGRNVHTLMPPPYDEEHDRRIATFLATGERKIIGIGREVEGRRKDGTTFPMELAVSEMVIGGERKFTGIVRDITERKQATAALQASLREKEVLLREIHHRVKNNLQIISSLLNLQAGQFRDEQALEMFRDTQHRVRSMALIHEHLYRSGTLSRIDMAKYLQALASHLFHAYGAGARRIRLAMTADPIPLSVDVAVPCGLIATELLTNALKYAYTQGQDGEIRVALHDGPDHRVMLTVADDGVGLPDALDLRATPTLGLQLVTTLTEQLGATLEVERGRGTAFTLRLNGQPG
jgi:PAS domain S-box-containing protein